eukprot:Nk52_evm73s1073 gene=Nk52_evmTU73s1073
MSGRGGGGEGFYPGQRNSVHHNIGPGNSGNSQGPGGKQRSVWNKYDSRVFTYRPMDAKIELETVWQSGFSEVERRFLKGKTEGEANGLLLQATSQNFDIYCMTVNGLLYGILSDPVNAPKFFKYLCYVARDGHAYGISQVTNLIHMHFQQLGSSGKKQLLFLLSEFARLKIMPAEGAFVALLRNINVGDIGDSHIWLCNAVLDALELHLGWVMTLTTLIPHALIAFLRAIVIHYPKSQFKSLKDKEVRFCKRLLREKFLECSVIGRDLIRLLIGVGQIPEMRDIWQDLLYNPKKLSPHFEGMDQLMALNTERVYIVYSLSPTLVNEVSFLLSTVRNGHQKRYQKWFAAKYLSNPEAENVICDIVRFMCVCYHPTNQQLCSDIVPRWVVIFWLLRLVKSDEMRANAKLAVFFDYLFFDANSTNIMNVEPGALLIFKSLGKYNDFSAELFEFLIVMSQEFYPAKKDIIVEHVKVALKTILEKGVVPSLAPVLDLECYRKEFKCVLDDMFGETSKQSRRGEIQEQASSGCNEPLKDHHEVEALTEQEEQYAFSTSEGDDSNLVDHVLSSIHLQNGLNLFEHSDVVAQNVKKGEVFPDELNPVVLNDDWALDDGMFRSLLKFVWGFRLCKACDLGEFSCTWGKCIAAILAERENSQPEIDSEDDRFFEQGGNVELLKENLQCFEILFEYLEKEPGRLAKAAKPSILREIILSAAEHYSKLRPFLLIRIFLKTSERGVGSLANSAPEKLYLSLHNTAKSGLVDKLKEDLENLQNENVNCFFAALPFIFKEYSELCAGSVQILYLVFSAMDARQLFHTSCSISTKEFSIFLPTKGFGIEEKQVYGRRVGRTKRKSGESSGGKESGIEQLVDSISSVLVASLEWETFEQFCLWQLLCAELSEYYAVMDALGAKLLSGKNPILKPHSHPEALSGMLLLLKQGRPSVTLLKQLLSLGTGFSRFCCSCLFSWVQRSLSSFQESLKSVLDDPIAEEKSSCILANLDGLMRVISRNKVCVEGEFCEPNDVKKKILSPSVCEKLDWLLDTGEKSHGVSKQYSSLAQFVTANKDRKESPSKAKSVRKREDSETQDEDIVSSRTRRKKTKVVESDSDVSS